MKKVIIAITSALVILLLVFGGTALAGKPDNPPIEDWSLASEILETLNECCASISGNISSIIGQLVNLSDEVADIGSNVTSGFDNVDGQLVNLSDEVADIGSNVTSGFDNIDGQLVNLSDEVADIGSNVTSILDNIDAYPKTYTYSGNVSANKTAPTGIWGAPDTFNWDFPQPGQRHVILSIYPASLPNPNDRIIVVNQLEDYLVTGDEYQVIWIDSSDDPIGKVYTVEFVGYRWTISAVDVTDDGQPVTAYYSAVETVVFYE